MKLVSTISLVFLTLFAIAQAPKPELVWGHTSGTPSNNDLLWEINKTPQNNMLICGTRGGGFDIDFGSGVSLAGTQGNQTLYLAEYSTSGTMNWEVHFDGFQGYLLDMEISDAGDIYMLGAAGTNQGNVTIDFDPGPGVQAVTFTAYSIFLLRLDAAGNFVNVATLCETVNYVSGDHMRVESMAIDDNLDVYIGGVAHGSYDLSPGGAPTIVNAVGEQTGFVFKYDSSGNHVWNHLYPKGWVYKLHVDASSDLIIGGLVKDSIDFDFGTGVSMHYVDPMDSTSSFLHKLDATGNYIWSQTSSEGRWNHVMDITSNANGDVFTTRLEGLFLNGGDLIINRFDASGNEVWSSTVDGGVVGVGRTQGLHLDSMNNVYVGGLFLGTLDFDPDPFTTYMDTSYNNTHEDNFVLKLDSLGDFVWEFGVGTYVYNLGNKDMFQLDDDLNVYIYNSFFEEVDVDPSPADSIFTTLFNTSDIYFLKYQQSPCGDAYSQLDSLADVTCAGDGYIGTTTLLGNPPFTYQWNNTPPSDSSNAVITTGGVYVLEVTDSLGCLFQTSYLVNEPSTYSGYDLQVNAVNTPFIVGQSFQIWIDAYNAGCSPQSGEVSFVLPDAADASYASSIAPNAVNGDTLIWYFPSGVYGDPHFEVQVMGTISQAATLGSVTCYSLSISPDTTDVNPVNNFKDYCEVILGSYDPNYKEVYPAGECDEHYTLLDETLTYTVHFQNTGTFQAFDIRVRDTIDSQLDVNSIHVVAESHDMHLEVLPNNVIDFIFSDINLPDSASNEPESHGFVIFEIDPLPGLATNTVVTNDVAIYFDYNDPIFTNGVFNTYIDTIPTCFLELETLTKDNVRIYPNPSYGNYTIDFNNIISTAEICVYSLDGRMIVQKNVTDADTVLINLEGQSAGVYWVQVTGNVNTTQKVILK